ncbi:gas vesicle protein [Streptomyces sp. HNM0645]|uniref:gas vesicle protein n=1 Tax=Streptomyces sp. HNM0645 TaxID=2782343 RepID=UPI0024B85C5E|nr:gas vesicle protein [Streptomyces sp. HNM0645]MDI9885515.1 gas vesicle protein [Streptomyces sp. HNM0645]
MPWDTRTAPPEAGPLAQRQLALVDLLDRLLAGGVVIKGDLTLRIADVDLVRIDLNALICSVGSVVASPFEDRGGSGPYGARAGGPQRGAA